VGKSAMGPFRWSGLVIRLPFRARLRVWLSLAKRSW
jgi:hypothetical protein